MGAILRPFPNTLITGCGGQIKPAGIPRIDWTHPLTRKLFSYWFDTGAGFLIDLVTGDIATTAATVLPGTVPSRFGTANYYNSTTAGLQSNRNATVQSWAAPFTVAQGWIQVAALGVTGSNFALFFGVQDTSGNDGFNFYCDGTESTTAIAYNSGNGSNAALIAVPAVNTFYVCVASTSLTTGTGATQIYLNGILTANTQFNNGTTSYSGAGLKYSFGQAVGSSGSTGSNSQIFFGAAWSRTLSRGEATLLYTDPYCFLVPAGEADLPALLAGAIAFSMTAATGNYSVTQEQELLARAAKNYPQATSFALTDEVEKLKKGSLSSIYVGNFRLNSAALTAFDPSNAGATIALSNGNLTATGITSTANSIVRSVAKTSSGKFYCEFTCTSASANATGVGICDASEILNGVSLGADLDGLGYENSNGTTGHVYINNNPTAIQGYNNGDNVGMAVDFDDKTIWFRTNGGNWNNSGTANPATNAGGIDISSLNAGSYYAAVNTFAVGDAITVNFGATAYSYTSPSGFFNWGAFTGGNEKLTKASKLTAQSTPYALTDEQLTALRTATANLQTDFYALTGGSPTLTFSIITAFNIVLSTGVYALTDESETLKAGRLDKAQTIQYALTDEQLLTLRGYRDKLQTNFYALTVEQEKILKNSLLFPQETPFAFVGGSFSLTTTTSLQVILSTGMYALTDETEKLLRKALILPQVTPYLKDGFSGARDFNGSSYLLPSASSATLNPAVLTMAAWVYPAGVLSGPTKFYSVMGYQGFAGDPNSHAFYLNSSAAGYYVELDVGADTHIGSTLISQGGWTHVAVTFSAGSVGSIYVNGVLYASVSFVAFSPTAAPFYIGWDSFNDKFIGGIADPAIWNTVLTGTQITNLAAGRRANAIGANANLAGYWPMLEQSPEPDASGGGNPGVLTGTTASAGPPQLDPYNPSGFETLLKGSKQIPFSVPFVENAINETLLKTSTLLPQVTPYLVNPGSPISVTLSGLLLHYTFDDGTATDSGGGGYDGTLVNGPSEVAGQINNALNFVQANAEYTHNTTFPWNTTQIPVSVSLWVNTPGGVGASAFNVGNQDNPDRFQAHIPYADNVLYWDYGNNRVQTNFASYLNRWTHVVLVSDGTSFQAIYLNGGLIASQPSATSPTVNLTGVDVGRWAQYFQGSIDDFQIYNRVLSLSEIQQIFNGGVGGNFGYENLFWNRDDKIQSVPYRINTEPTDLARSFNGSSDYVNLGAHTWDPTTSATFASWVYIIALPANYAGIFTVDNPNPALFYLTSAGQLAFYIFNNWGNAANNPLLGGPTLSTGQWYHLAWTVVSGGNLNFYLNGILNGSFAVGTGGGGSSIEQALLGQDITSGLLYPFNGYMSDIALWNTVLTGTQISNLAAGQRANTIATPNLIMNLPITGASPEPDVSGPQGRYGTLNGTSIAAGPPTLQSYTPIEGYETLLKDSVDYPQAGFYNLKVESITLSTLVPFLMVLGTGTYLLTDESLVLIKTSRLGAQTGIYSLNDEQLRTLKGSRLKDTAGTYSIVGEQLTLKAARKANLQATFYNLAGEAVTLIAPAGAFAMNIGTGAYVLTDETLTLLKGSHLYPQRVPYNITEFNTIIPQSFFLFPNTAYYALTDEQETLLKASTNNVQVGTYQLTDEQLALLKGLKLQGTAGFYTFNGEQLTLKATRLDHPQTGLYNLIEPSFSLTIPGQFFMTVTTGNYAVTDENETFLKTSHVTIQPISYAFTVETEQTLRAAAAFPQTGSYVLTPEQLREIKKSRLSAQAVTYSLVIENEQLLRGRLTGLQTGTYSLTGKQITDAITSVSMKLVSGTYLLTVEALQVSTTAPVIIVNFTATPMLLGREADSTLKGGEVEPELEGQIS